MKYRNFLKNEEIKENFKAKGLKKAKQELDILKLPDDERIAYERYRDDLHYQASMVESTYIIGMKKGEKKGEKKGVNRVAQKLISAGLLDVADIAEVTGLTIEEIEILKTGTKTGKS